MEKPEMTALEHLQEAAATAIDAGMSLHEFKHLAAAAMVDRAISQTNSNQSRAARIIQTHRNTLWRNWAKKIPKRRSGGAE